MAINKDSFVYHAPKGNQVERYQIIREAMKDLVQMIEDLCPLSAERTIAIRRIEESSMWANKSIAVNEARGDGEREYPSKYDTVVLMPGWYKKRPGKVQAISAARVFIAYSQGGDHMKGLPPWVTEAYETGMILAITEDSFCLAIDEDLVTVTPSDYLLRGVDGELYPVPWERFQKLYEVD